MNYIVSSLQSGKIRIIEIAQSEYNYNYVQQCFKEIARISKFQYKKEFLTNDYRYFGFIIDEKPYYLKIDTANNSILVHDVKSEETNTIAKENYEAIKSILFSSKSATYYIKRNELIKTVHKFLWYFLMAMCSILFVAYFINMIGDGKFTVVALSIFVILALQDCVNVFLPRFERKHYDKYLYLLISLEIIYAILTILALILSGKYNELSHSFNLLSIMLTFGTILIKFEKPNKNG